MVYLNTPLVSPPSTTNSAITTGINSNFFQSKRLFTGVSGLNITRTGNKSFEFLLYTNSSLGFQFSPTGIVNVDYALLAVYVLRCATGVYRQAVGDCVANCPLGEYKNTLYSLDFCQTCHYSCSGCYDPSPTSCINCQATRTPIKTSTINGINMYSCSCSNGYFDNYAATCLTCGISLPGCATCLNNATCVQCFSGMRLVNGKCICNDTKQFYFGGVCRNRILGCETHNVTSGGQLICT